MLILASASQSRRNLLESAHIKFIQIPSNFDESLIKEEKISDLAAELSFHKANNVIKNIKELNFEKIFNFNSIEIIGCDSVFEFQGRVFGKPLDKDEASKRWSKMSGNFGFLHTGHTLLICEVNLNEKRIIVSKKITETLISKVYFSKLTDEEINRYVDSLEPLSCAGGFALEGRGGKYIEKIEGCFSNVMGLSLPWLKVNLDSIGLTGLLF